MPGSLRPIMTRMLGKHSATLVPDVQAPIRERVVEKLPRRRQRQSGHDEGDGGIGPPTAKPRDRARRQDYRDIADGVVAAAQPDRELTTVAGPEPEHECRADYIRLERQCDIRSHHHGTRHTTLHQILNGTAEHPKP